MFLLTQDKYDEVLRQRDALAEALRLACPADIEETCDECAPGPCIGCWVLIARAALSSL